MNQFNASEILALTAVRYGYVWRVWVDRQWIAGDDKYRGTSNISVEQTIRDRFEMYLICPHTNFPPMRVECVGLDAADRVIRCHSEIAARRKQFGKDFGVPDVSAVTVRHDDVNPPPRNYAALLAAAKRKPVAYWGEPAAKVEKPALPWVDKGCPLSPRGTYQFKQGTAPQLPLWCVDYDGGYAVRVTKDGVEVPLAEWPEGIKAQAWHSAPAKPDAEWPKWITQDALEGDGFYCLVRADSSESCMMFWREFGRNMPRRWSGDAEATGNWLQAAKNQTKRCKFVSTPDTVWLKENGHADEAVKYAPAVKDEEYEPVPGEIVQIHPGDRFDIFGPGHPGGMGPGPKLAEGLRLTDDFIAVMNRHSTVLHASGENLICELSLVGLRNGEVRILRRRAEGKP